MEKVYPELAWAFIDETGNTVRYLSKFKDHFFALNANDSIFAFEKEYRDLYKILTGN